MNDVDPSSDIKYCISTAANRFGQARSYWMTAENHYSIITRINLVPNLQICKSVC